MKDIADHIIAHKTIKVKAIRTNCTSSEHIDTEVEVDKHYYKGHLNSWWIRIVSGGVTGYESMEVAHVHERLNDGWCACAGTKGRWDKLFIPNFSMREIKEWLDQDDS